MNEEYEVYRILQRGRKRGVIHYLVHWKGYPQEQATWQPLSNLTDCHVAIQEFQDMLIVMKAEPSNVNLYYKGSNSSPKKIEYKKFQSMKNDTDNNFKRSTQINNNQNECNKKVKTNEQEFEIDSDLMNKQNENLMKLKQIQTSSDSRHIKIAQILFQNANRMQNLENNIKENQKVSAQVIINCKKIKQQRQQKQQKQSEKQVKFKEQNLKQTCKKNRFMECDQLMEAQNLAILKRAEGQNIEIEIKFIDISCMKYRHQVENIYYENYEIIIMVKMCYKWIGIIRQQSKKNHFIWIDADCIKNQAWQKFISNRIT